MNTRKPDEMEKSYNLKAARNTSIFYTAALLGWGIYSLITKGDGGWAMNIFMLGVAVFAFSKTFFYKQTETEEEKVKIPAKPIISLIFYVVLFLAIILVFTYL